MNSKVMIIVYGFIVIYCVSQVAECKSGSRVMKYGKAISKRIGRYTRPLLMGTEKTAEKLTRDVGVASRYTAKNAINGMLLINKRLHRVLRFAKKRFVKKKNRSAAPAPAPAPEPEPEPEPAAEAAPEEHHDETAEPAAEEHHEDSPAEEHHEDSPAEEHHEDEPATETAVEHTDENPA